MNIDRRGFLGLTGVVAASAALAACAGTGSSGSAGTSGSASDANTIKFWSNHPGKSQDVEKELIARFQAKYPDLTVDLVDGGKNYEEVSQKFNAALSGGDLPDVVVLSDVWWFNYALAGAITPLDDLFTEVGVDTGDYVDSLLADYLFEGRHFALPYARSTPLFYYNRDVWRQAGLPDRGPATWQEFSEWGPELQRAVGSGKLAHGWGNAKDYLGWTFEGPIWTFGGAYSDGWRLRFGDAETIAAGQFLKDMIHTGKYAGVSTDIANDFSAGIIASTIASTGDLSGITKNAAFDFGTAFLPAPDGTPGCPTGGAGLAIPANISDERKRNALKFIDFVTNGENTAYFSQRIGYMPVRKSATENPDMKAFLEQNPNSRTAVDQLARTRSQDYARVFVPGGDQIIGTGLEQIALQGADVTTAFGDVTRQLQQIIDRQITPYL
ncbi:ABC transporter substrate-binding protein [Rhodococcus aetherivorans]|uniref:Glycerol-3-phosphate ABC transporter, periplasmic glycerol-3-phosphate-binding protein n=1 Tax=Rhodococcus aetherivorans TaxID=191292 RepID=A0ABQ0YJ44_9NOCA|nr:ABC transporter substrate-binding protein [Rhodococcus aetherivorans]ETT23619.1 ABC-type sugar transport system periplasmic component-like protein [Rhodococcus rhodochrous ATCC 21198]NGP27078.1 ABC transporter substrate-binding protein [Rhodococcus aetherivorans]GES36581.1 glycerol-3-phosphate ABC transporter, periplasmic glycerol-3-phosphate-binding protein [Rhodococcus aetherivorans]CCW09998.1 Glycerol-3-phosphate ABC transporter, periplasmic glycerol-3-phosphate-binding protein (TC 3.A.1.